MHQFVVPQHSWLSREIKLPNRQFCISSATDEFLNLFLKKLFYVRDKDRGRSGDERDFFLSHWFTPQNAAIARAGGWTSLKPGACLGLPVRCRGLGSWATLCCFLGCMRKEWIESGVARTLTSAHMEGWCFQAAA